MSPGLYDLILLEFRGFWQFKNVMTMLEFVVLQLSFYRAICSNFDFLSSDVFDFVTTIYPEDDPTG